MNNTKLIIGFVSFPTKELASSTAEKLIMSKLAACVKLLAPVTSFYEWEGKFEQAEEHYIMIKSLESKADEINLLIKESHTYEVFEFIYSHVDGGNEEYIDWVKKTLL